MAQTPEDVGLQALGLQLVTRGDLAESPLGKLLTRTEDDLLDRDIRCTPWTNVWLPTEKDLWNDDMLQDFQNLLKRPSNCPCSPPLFDAHIQCCNLFARLVEYFKPIACFHGV